MTSDQKAMVREIGKLARLAWVELGTNAGDGPKGRPTVAQLNRTIDRLRQIELEAAHVLAANLPSAF